MCQGILNFTPDTCLTYRRAFYLRIFLRCRSNLKIDSEDEKVNTHTHSWAKRYSIMKNTQDCLRVGEMGCKRQKLYPNYNSSLFSKRESFPVIDLLDEVGSGASTGVKLPGDYTAPPQVPWGTQYPYFQSASPAS